MLPCEWLLLKRSSLWILNLIIEVSYYDWIKNWINLISQNLTTFPGFRFLTNLATSIPPKGTSLSFGRVCKYQQLTGCTIYWSVLLITTAATVKCYSVIFQHKCTLIIIKLWQISETTQVAPYWLKHCNLNKCEAVGSQSLWQFLRVSLAFGKILYLIWQLYYAIGQIVFVRNGRILNKKSSLMGHNGTGFSI